MEQERVRLFLIASPDDPAGGSADYQKGLRQFMDALKAAGVEFSSHAELREAAGVETIYLGDFGIKLVATIGPVLGGMIGAWLHARYGRKVRLKVGDIEAEAQSAVEVEKLLARALEIQKQQETKMIREP